MQAPGSNPEQSSPQYLRGSGEREVADWKKGERRPLSVPLAPNKRIFYVSMFLFNFKSQDFIQFHFSIYLICVSEYEPSWQNVLKSVTTHIPD